MSWRTYRSPNGEAWARVSGNRMVLKEELFGETVYLAIEGGRVVSVADSAERAMEVWSEHRATVA